MAHRGARVGTRVVALGASAIATGWYLRHRHRRRRAEEPMVLVVGDAFVDVLVSGLPRLPRYDADVLAAQPIELCAGGTALNTAVHMSDIGEAVELRTAVGADEFGKFLKGECSKRAVHLVQLACDGGGTGCCVVLSGAGDRGFATHRGVVDSMAIGAADVKAAQAVGKRGGHVHVAGYYNSTEMRRGVAGLIGAANAAGSTTSLAAQTDAAEEWGGIGVEVRGASAPTFLILSKNEARQIARARGLKSDGSPAGDARALVSDEEDGGAAAARCCVVTLGASGALLVTADGTRLDQAAVSSSSPQIIDATGAGDAFAAGFLTGFAQSRSLRQALRLGCALGACCVNQRGASTPLDQAAVHAAYAATKADDTDAPLPSSSSKKIKPPH